MPFSVASILQAALLVANALAVLNERRFLRKFGLGDPATAAGTVASPFAAADGSSHTASSAAPAAPPSSNPFYAMDMADRRDGGFFPQSPRGDDAVVPSASTAESKAQIGRLLASVRMLLRWPLIVANAVCIVFALVFG